MVNCENCGKEFDNCGIFNYCDDCADLVAGVPDCPDDMCEFCGEWMDYSPAGGFYCRNCGYDEDYERLKIGRNDDY
jgi:hypothetical protein